MRRVGKFNENFIQSATLVLDGETAKTKANQWKNAMENGK